MDESRSEPAPPPREDVSPRAPASPFRSILERSARAISRSRALEFRLKALTEELHTPEERAIEIAESALDALDATVSIAARLTLDGLHVELVGAAHLPGDLSARLQHVPVDADVPLAEVVRTGTSIYCVSRDDITTRYPEMRDLADRLGLHALAALPVRFLGALYGGVMFGFPSPRPFTAADRSAMRAQAARYARALRESRHYFAEREARAAESAARGIAEEGRAVAEAAARAKGDFVAVVSHELRTPLQAILGYSELLAEGVAGELNPTQEEFARRIALGGRALLQVVENLLGFSAAQLGRQRPDVVSFDLGRVVDEVVQLAEPLAREKRITVRADVASLRMTSDPQRVRQIVTNLVGNAIKFTERGEVAISIAASAPITPGGAAPAEPRVRIAVRDTGPGIDATDLPRLFEPFWRGSPSLPAQPQGTGLGLSIVRQLARLLGGDVQVESEPGVGSTFSVVLPLQLAVNGARGA